MARQGRMLDVSKEQLFLALASEVPQDGKVVANPYTKWSEIDSSLPDIEIQVFGPPPTSGTRDAFVELVMEEGCARSEEHTSELQSLMRISYAVFCLKKKNNITTNKQSIETEKPTTPDHN